MLKAAIVMGSDSDLGVLSAAAGVLEHFSIPFEVKVLSAHRTPEAALAYAASAEKRGFGVLIAGAGGAAHLPGVLAAVTLLPVIGVPKTIDNDLSATDVTFGFDSALNVATEAVDRVHTTAQSHHRVMIVETMGRYAGWIALRAGIAGGGDIILLPEIPYRAQDIIGAVLERKRRGKKFSIIVVAEGAKPEKGEMTVTKVVKGSPDPLRLGGVSYKIAEILEGKVGLESRVVVLGHVQRGGEPTAFDRWLATGFGVKAGELLAEKKFGRMVSFKDFGFTSVSIAAAVGKLRRVSPGSQEVRTALAVGTCFGNSRVAGRSGVEKKYAH